MNKKVVGYKPEMPDTPCKDIKGVDILPGMRVAYGDWGNRIKTGTVREYRWDTIMIDPDSKWCAWRQVFQHNSQKMILVLGE